MILLLLCFLALAAGLLLWHFGGRWQPRHHGWQLVWRVALLIGLVRIGALWAGAAALQIPGGWAYFAAFFIAMLGLPELYLVMGLHDHTLNWLIAGSVLLSVTSFVWAALLVWVVGRLQLTSRAPE